ncbi:MAG TPA: AarF/ABC1/UbiB kinase family protein [Candidatus Nanoarchaeia archaeon]|nr:AarF/ABC1/UbiB kinase family protein [Candidatus Nanoarchaeia archaeon]
MTLYDIFKNHQHRHRLAQILEVFAQQEFGYLISQIKLGHHLPFVKRLKARIEKEKQTNAPIRLRQAFEQLGPTFIKFGQLLSLRPDLIPPEFVAEFEKMQDKVPTVPFSEMKLQIEQELHCPLEKVFSSLDQKPIASASIAQVYKAKMGGKIVAVKVQRPSIQETIKTDIELMYKIAELLENQSPHFRNYHLRAIIHEFEKWTIKELNFKIEAHYAEKIRANNLGSKFLKIPQIYPAYCTERVLVMEFMEGTPLHDVKQLKKKKINIRTVLKNGFDAFLKQVFIDGLFHADPHPGNILVLKGGKIALIDFGIVGQFDRKLKENTLDLFRTIIESDYENAATVLLKMSPEAGIEKEVLVADLKEIFEQFHYAPIKDIQMGPILSNILSLINKHRLRVPFEFVLFGKTIIILEGVALKYQPNLHLFGEAKATLEKFFDHTYFTTQILQKTSRKIAQYKELAEVFPETALELLQKAKEFKLNINLEDKEVRDLTTEIERSSGNISVGAIIAALIVASALMMQTAAPAYFPVSGFILGGVLSLWLIHRTLFIKIKRGEQNG